MCVLYTRLDHHPLFSHYAKLCEANQPIEWKSDKIGIKLIVRVASMTPTPSCLRTSVSRPLSMVCLMRIYMKQALPALAHDGIISIWLE